MKLRCLLFAAVLTLKVLADTSYTSQGATFSLPIAFSRPTKLGMGAEVLQFPEKAANDEIKAEIITFTAGAEQQKRMADAGQPIRKYFMSTYLGITEAPLEINKAVIGDLGGRHLVYEGSIPRKNRVDVYERDLPDGRFFAIAVRTFEAMDQEESLKFREVLRKSVKYQ